MSKRWLYGPIFFIIIFIFLIIWIPPLQTAADDIIIRDIGQLNETLFPSPDIRFETHKVYYIGYGVKTYVFHKDIPLCKERKRHYRFIGWKEKDSNKIITYLPADTNRDYTLYPVFEPETYKIIYSDGSYDEYRYGEPIQLKESTKEHYIFNGWKTREGDIITKTSIDTYGDLFLEADFTPEQYEIELQGCDNLTYCYNQSISLPSIEKEHYIFKGWSQNESGQDYITEIDPGQFGNLTLYPVFEPETYTIKYDGYDQQDTYVFGEDKQLMIPTKKHYIFNGWHTNKDSTVITKVKSGTFGNVVFYPSFSPQQYTITYNLDGGTNNGPITYYADETVYFGTPIKTGYKFVGWVVNGVGERSNTNGLFKNITVSAQWKKIYDLTVNRLWVGDYTAGIYRSFEQYVCDAKDSACLMELRGMNLIGDHNYQGFTAISSNTTATMVLDGRILILQRTGLNYGYNQGHYLVYSNGTTVTCENTPADFIMYTCNSYRGDGVIITTWDIVDIQYN